MADSSRRGRASRRAALFGVALVGLGSAASAGDAPKPYATTEVREACAAFEPDRRPFFGDTHVHTTFSQDASTQGTQVTPRDAYRFAKGEPLGIQPHDERGQPLRTVALERPLDFTVVTDHGEQIGEVHICKTPGAPGHDSWVCRIYRSAPRAAFYLMNGRYSLLGSRWSFCGEDGAACLDAAGTVWAEIQDAAEGAYDRSASCRFTSFVGYEWTAGPGAGSHLHRNVVFRNEHVIELPITTMETGHRALALWEGLDAQCRDGCEVLTIPHNSNLGGGTTFTSADVIGEEINAREAPLRARYDRLVEVMQHKGDSECALVGDTTDEACGFEKSPPASPLPFAGTPELRTVDFARDALKRGLALDPALGVNPLKFGLIASTDTHLGTPGLTKERGHPGHGGAGKYARDEVPPGLPDDLGFNPGGLAVLWAEENSRDSLFAAMLRREAYGTSGNRPALRLFGGWSFDESACAMPDLAAHGYANGVPMGGDLPPAKEQSAPSFLVSGMRDPHESAAPLQRIEIVKGWVDGDARRERVVAVAGGPNDASVDPATCARRGSGADQLCAIWQDPHFDPAQPAFYYARLLENPSCRWSQWACIDAGVDCTDPSTISEGFEPCCAPEHEPTVQERAWSSPIWYTPDG